jgi:polyhydroxyalkanoate synthase subunit PhaC
MSTSDSIPKMPDADKLAAQWQEVSERSQRVAQDFMERQQAGGKEFQLFDPAVLGQAYGELIQSLMSNPGALLEGQLALWQDYAKLWERTTRRLAGQEVEAGEVPNAGDRRFKHDDWNDVPLFDHLKQSYLLVSRYLLDTVHGAEGLDEKTAQKIDFYTRQFVDAMAPTNFAASNPAVMRETAESGGENLVRGLTNMLDDLERGDGKLRIKMTDMDKFKLGENVAVSPGKVVFQNDLMQLLQYTPSTKTVFRRPLLILPPWINKYYILDLREQNSFIKWAVDEGHTVFVVSWANPDSRHAEKTFEDYMVEGPLAALDAIEAATGEREAKLIGYCLGGTLLAACLSYMKSVGDDRVKAATFFTTMTDFTEPGELGVFIDDETVTLMEESMEGKGYFEGSTMAEAFNLLRSNDLIWSFVVNNYLMGKDPFPFDLLYWNSDSTRLPAKMHSYYLRNMYQHNRLIEPGALELCGQPIDLRTVDHPVYILSTREDHIAPWRSTYAATQLYGGSTRFVLGASGHIAGVVNPPSANKYSYWTNTDLPADPDAWLEAAEHTQGSWWNDWKKWVSKYNGGRRVPARIPGDGDLTIIEDAPGSYVKVRAD